MPLLTVWGDSASIAPVSAPLFEADLAQAAAVADDVRRSTDGELGLVLGDLARWVGIDSPSGDGEAVSRVAADIASRLGVYGLYTELTPGEAGAHLRATLEGAGPSRVALLCHHDTVFERGTARRRPMTVDGVHARGPGVADMKGGIAVAVHALRLLLRHRGRVGRVELVSTPDEELRTDPFPGIERLDGFDAVLCMECGRPGNGIVTARKGGHWLSLELSGRAAHAGVDAESGRSALLAACREALRLAALDGAREGLGVHVTTLRAGEGPNSVASTAALTVDLRAWRDDDLDWALAQARSVGGHDGVEPRLSASTRVPPLERTPAVARLAALAGALAERAGTPLVEVATGGVSDACWTAAAGIPSIDGLGPVGRDDHSPDESIEVASLAQRCGLLAGLVAAVDAGRRVRKPEKEAVP